MQAAWIRVVVHTKVGRRHRALTSMGDHRSWGNRAVPSGNPRPPIVCCHPWLQGVFPWPLIPRCDSLTTDFKFWFPDSWLQGVISWLLVLMCDSLTTDFKLSLPDSRLQGVISCLLASRSYILSPDYKVDFIHEPIGSVSMKKWDCNIYTNIRVLSRILCM